MLSWQKTTGDRMLFVQNTEHKGTKFQVKVNDDDDRQTQQLNVQQHPTTVL